MNIQQLKYVLTVAENKSFGKAAKELFVSQSTLSTMIGKFEDEIGIEIFDRRYKPIDISKEGREVIDQIRIVLNELENLNHVTKVLKGEEGGALRLGIIPTVAPYLLPLFINSAASRMSRTKFVVSELTTAEIISNLQSRSLDIGILSLPIYEDEIIETTLYTEPFYLFDGANTLAKKKVNPLDLDTHRLWLMDEGHCMRTQVVTVCDLLNKQDLKRHLEYKSGSIDTLMRFVRQNRGLTLLPHLATHDLNKEDQKKLRKFIDPAPSRAIGIATHRHFKKKKAKQIIIEEIQDNVKSLLPKKANNVVVDPVITS